MDYRHRFQAETDEPIATIIRHGRSLVGTLNASEWNGWPAGTLLGEQLVQRDGRVVFMARETVDPDLATGYADPHTGQQHWFYQRAEWPDWLEPVPEPSTA